MLNEQDISKFEQLIGYTFKNKDLIIQAFTHSSFVNEQKINKKPEYERLEFLGDAVLEMISSAFLFKKYPDKKEGEMSQIRASLVCEPALAFDSEQLELKNYIQLGKGEEATGGRNKDSIISDVMEAVIGALLVLKIQVLLPFIMSFAAGAMIFVVLEELIPEVMQNKRKDIVSFLVMIGFLL